MQSRRFELQYMKYFENLIFSPEAYIHPPRVPSKRAFQRSLHESYQYMMKSMIDAANQEAYRRKKLLAMSNPEPTQEPLGDDNSAYND